MDLAPLPTNPWLFFVCFLVFFLFFDVAGFFVCLVLIDYVVCSVFVEHIQRFEVCSVLVEHVQRFEPQVSCSQRDSAL